MDMAAVVDLSEAISQVVMRIVQQREMCLVNGALADLPEYYFGKVKQRIVLQM